MSIYNTILKIINIIKSILITFTPIGTLYNLKKDYDRPFNLPRAIYRFIGFLFGLFAIYLSSVCNENINFEIIFALLFAPIYVGYKLFNDPTLCNILPPIFKLLGIEFLQENMKESPKVPTEYIIPKVTVKENIVKPKPITSVLPFNINQSDINIRINTKPTPSVLPLNFDNNVKIRSKLPVRLTTKSPVKLSTKSPVRLTTKSPVRLTTKSPTSFSLPLTTPLPKPN